MKKHLFKLAFLGALIGGALPALAQPIIQSINPPKINETAGDHVAFNVNATGTGSLAYQWYSNNAALAGQTGASLVLSNIQPPNSATYTVTVEDSTSAVVSNSATLNVSSSYLPYYPSNVVVARVGDGVQVLSGATGNTLYLDQYQPNGIYVSTVMVPDETPGSAYGTGSSGSVVGSSAVLVQGAGADAQFEGQLLLSSNQNFLCFAGYCQNYPFAGPDVTAPTGNWRGMATVDGFGYYNLAYTNYGFYNGGNHTIRGMVSPDGLSVFWTIGQAGAGGVKYGNITNTAYSDGVGEPPISGSTGTGCYAITLPANGAVVYSDALASPAGLWYLPAGTPEAGVSGGYFNRASLLAEGGSPAAFAFSPDYKTVYIADLRTYSSGTQSGGIQRWDSTSGFTAGGYTNSYTLPATAASSAGAFGLAVNFPTNITSWGPGVTGAVIYATTTGAAGNSLTEMVDTGASSTPSTIITTGPNQALRGVSLAPLRGPAVIGVQPQPQSAFVGGAAVFNVLAGNGPGLAYQWQLNGTNLSNGTSISGSGATISGAQTANLTVINVGGTDAQGNYTVVVSNSDPNGAVTSSPPALLKVPVAITGLPPSTEYVFSNGVATFTVVATGGAPLAYQWTGPCGPLSNGAHGDPCNSSAVVAGANSASLTISGVGPVDTGSYYVTVTNNVPSSANNESAPTVLTVSESDAPQIDSDIQPSSLTLPVGNTVVFTVSASSPGTLSYQWLLDGTNLTDNSRLSGSLTPTLTIANVQLNDSGTYRLIVSNSAGYVESSPALLTVTLIGVNNGVDWSVNGNASITNGVLALVQGTTSEDSSSFLSELVDVTAFRASWIYQDAGGGGSDGTTFVLQNDPSGTAALGGGGGDLGYIGIANSVGLEFNIYNGHTIGIALGTEGAGSAAGPYSTPGSVNLASGDPIGVSLEYLNDVMNVVLTDSVSHVSFTTNIAINVPAAVGNNTAYVGFTGASGAAASTQTISNFFFTSLPAVTIQGAGGGTMVLTWSIGAPGFLLQQTTSLSSPNWVNATNVPVLVNGQNQVTVTTTGTTEFYRLSTQ